MSVVAICKGEVIDTFSYGLSDLNRSVPVSNSTRYRIASISKHVDSIGLMQLYERGLFDLDDDISDALGFRLRNPYFPDVAITYRMILSHQSSIGEGSLYSDFITYTYSLQSPPYPSIKELLLPGGKWFTVHHFIQERPGTFFSYSNINFGLVGTLIEALSGVRFDVYMRQHVFLPLGLNASYNVADIEDISNLAVLYRDSKPQADNYGGKKPVSPDYSKYVLGTNALIFGPAGGLRVTALELATL